MPEILELGTPPVARRTLIPGTEIETGRRAFATAQQYFLGGPVDVEQQMTVGWYDTSVNPETGCFALVQQNAGLDDWVGEILRVTFGRRVVFVYVLDTADVPWQLALARRPFVALHRPSVEQIVARVVPTA